MKKLTASIFFLLIAQGCKEKNDTTRTNITTRFENSTMIIDEEDELHDYWKKYCGHDYSITKRYHPNNLGFGYEDDFIFLFPKKYSTVWAENKIDFQLAEVRILSAHKFGLLCEEELAKYEIDWPVMKNKELENWWKENYIAVLKETFSEYSFPKSFKNSDLEGEFKALSGMQTPTMFEKRKILLEKITELTKDYNNSNALLGNSFENNIKKCFAKSLEKHGLIKKASTIK